ncbi:hypothetical protein TWF481_000267 [Arthrobotrys musiformis]|uniref:Uncharacterized protein n=1 Tax=Arthrobotrys musiformis TaxID=47236 RepID=A0AAV9WP40_9PEZI
MSTINTQPLPPQPSLSQRDSTSPNHRFGRRFFSKWKAIVSYIPINKGKDKSTSFWKSSTKPSVFPKRLSTQSGSSASSDRGPVHIEYSKPLKIEKPTVTSIGNMLPHSEDTGEPVVRGEGKHEIPFVDLLTWLFGNSEYDHNKTVFVDALHPERSLTAFDVEAQVKSLIGGLRSIGVKPGDAVCIHSFNDIMYPILFLAIIGCGAAFVGTNPGYTAFELEHHFKISGTKFIFVQPSLFKNVNEAAQRTSIPSTRIFAFDTEGQILKEEDGLRSFKELLEHEKEDWIKFDDEKSAKTTLMGLFASSGTTGLPKVIAISHYAWVAGSVVLREPLLRPYEVKRLMCLPSFHGFAAPLTIGVPLRLGQTTYILPRFDLGAFVNAAAKFEINETAVAPPVLQGFLKSPPETQNKLKTIKRVWCGGAPLNVKLQTEARSCFDKDAEIVNIWGMTEIGITVGMKYDDIDRTGAASKLLANTEARIVDDSGVNITHTGEQGEVQIRTPQCCSGYWGNPKATSELILPDGWVRTGDVAYFKDGKLYIMDRKKEMIKVRGWQVAPAELEAILITHPCIKDAAVIGIKVGAEDDEHEVPRAYVVPVEAGGITETEVKEFVLSKLSKYKALDGGVYFVEAIPKSPAGKILKKIIRAEWLSKGEQKPMA